MRTKKSSQINAKLTAKTQKMILDPRHYDFSDERHRKAEKLAAIRAKQQARVQAKMDAQRRAEKIRQAELHQKDLQMTKDKAAEKKAKLKLFALSHTVVSTVQATEDMEVKVSYLTI